jgi:UDP-N-acetylglucosamine--N-acetylmuramyl-(pentapeptide) pyrophosphoryl-undecaprenol N-acetylglucosamine transferase
LIPSPYVAHNHQEQNARYLEKNGAAEVLTESNLNGKTLLETIQRVLSDTDKLREMSEASKKMGITNACEKIYKLAVKLTRE